MIPCGLGNLNLYCSKPFLFERHFFRSLIFLLFKRAEGNLIGHNLIWVTALKDNKSEKEIPWLFCPTLWTPLSLQLLQRLLASACSDVHTTVNWKEHFGSYIMYESNAQASVKKASASLSRSLTRYIYQSAMNNTDMTNAKCWDMCSPQPILHGRDLFHNPIVHLGCSDQ